jgi:hypothetical protein
MSITLKVNETTHTVGIDQPMREVMDIVGRIVEVVSDQSLEVYFRENIFAPLGMADTGFLISTAQKQRTATNYARQADGSLKAFPFEMPQRPSSPGWWAVFNATGLHGVSANAPCYYWVDPVKKLTATMFTQLLPFYDARVVELYGKFEQALYGDLDRT